MNSYFPSIGAIIDGYDLSLADFRTSDNMKVLFCRLVEDCIAAVSLSSVQVSVDLSNNTSPCVAQQVIGSCCFWNSNESIKRLDCWMNIFINILNIPLMSSMAGVGSYFSLPVQEQRKLLSTHLQSSGVSKDNVGSSNRYKSTKIESDIELLAKIKYLLQKGFALIIESERQIQLCGQDDALDTARVDLIVQLLVFRLSSFVPYHVSIFESGSYCLKYLTCSLLGVRGLSDDIKDAIKKINITIRSQLFSDEFNELVPNEKMEHLTTILTTNIGKYIRAIRQNSSKLSKYCRDNDIKSALDPRIVRELKAETYQSMRDVISVYQRKYRSRLNMLPIPLQSLQLRDIRQAMKDIQRERILINDQVYFGTSDTNNNCSSVNSSNIIKSDVLDGIMVLIAQLIWGSSPLPQYLSGAASSCSNSSSDVTCNSAADVRMVTPPRPSCVSSGTGILNISNSNTPNMSIAFPDIALSCDEISQESDGVSGNNGSSTPLTNVVSVSDLVQFLSSDVGIVATPRSTPSRALSHSQPLSVPSSMSVLAIERKEESVKQSTEGVDVDLGIGIDIDTSDTESLSLSAGTGQAYSRSSSLTSTTTVASAFDDDLSPPKHSVEDDAHAKTPSEQQRQQIQKEQQEQNLLKLLLNYVILAACRTTAGGDAFVLLNHLYGGESLSLCPSRHKCKKAKNNVDTYTTRIVIGKDAITVTLYDRYDLISTEHEVVGSSGDVAVLMSFVCNSVTQVTFEGFKQENGSLNIESLCKELISNPETVCKQFVSLRPELPSQA